MNVFEDLIEELRDENLLENTIIDASVAEARLSRNGSSSRPAASGDGSTGHDSDHSDSSNYSSPSEGEENERDFYRKRAVEEISSLQMVEHVLSAIEREHMKITPSVYNDLGAKTALHKFLQVQGDSATTEYAEAEFHLMRETETWNSALSLRDGKISVANLRRFCENSRPPLSSQALLALARFYRNSAFAEPTRAKFDFVMTRLFSREAEEQKRKLLFGRAEMIGHIGTLYANWSSIALYSADDIPSKARAIVAGFEERIAEAESSSTFDQLIENDFFKKINEFKEATGEAFFTPEVVAVSIDCNTRVGNKFVDLLRLESESSSLETVEQKYGCDHDEVVSDAAGKTLQLIDVLNNLPESVDGAAQDPAAADPSVKKLDTGLSSKASKKDRQPFVTFELFAVNKWLLLATMVVLMVSGSLYFWAGQPSNETSSAESASDVSFENSELKEFVRTGRSTSETLYAVTLPSWDQLDEAKKREVLQKGLEFATKNGQKNVQFLNVRGRSVGFASQKKFELLNP
ncbi:MAG TPA: hypothetical protein VMZ26_07625 [Pyrinomonadaceae bacterium]|nr:hypothetical protein [Pyrinomonadaceae bacterium]